MRHRRVRQTALICVYCGRWLAAGLTVEQRDDY
jgi:hypothetical protein